MQRLEWLPLQDLSCFSATSLLVRLLNLKGLCLFIKQIIPLSNSSKNCKVNIPPNTFTSVNLATGEEIQTQWALDQQSQVQVNILALPVPSFAPW